MAWMWWAPTGKVMQIFAGHAAGGCLGSGAVFSAVQAYQLRRFLWMLGAGWQGLPGICGGIWVGIAGIILFWMSRARAFWLIIGQITPLAWNLEVVVTGSEDHGIIVRRPYTVYLGRVFKPGSSHALVRFNFRSPNVK